MTILVEYITFGWNIQYLLQVLLLQVIVLTFEAPLGMIFKTNISNGNILFVRLLFLFLSMIFVIFLSVFVYMIGVRTFSPRFHRPVHLVLTVFSYLLISGCVTIISYVITTGITPGERIRVRQTEVLSGLVLIAFFAMSLAAGYLYRIMNREYPTREEMVETITAWNESLDWAEGQTGSYKQEQGYRDFRRRTDEMSTLLSHATTIEGVELYEDFQKWRRQFEMHSMHIQKIVMTNSKGNRNLKEEYENLDDITNRLEKLV